MVWGQGSGDLHKPPLACSISFWRTTCNHQIGSHHSVYVGACGVVAPASKTLDSRTMARADAPWANRHYGSVLPSTRTCSQRRWHGAGQRSDGYVRVQRNDGYGAKFYVWYDSLSCEASNNDIMDVIAELLGTLNAPSSVPFHAHALNNPTRACWLSQRQHDKGSWRASGAFTVLEKRQPNSTPQWCCPDVKSANWMGSPPPSVSTRKDKVKSWTSLFL